MDKVSIEYFTDVLCVWAYSAQIRMEELRKNYGDQVSLRYRFIPIFGAAKHRISKGWKDKGGFEGFNQSLQKSASSWEHINLHPKVWLQNVPASSTSTHLYLKAIQILENDNKLPTEIQTVFGGRTLFEEFFWRIRCAFFEKTKNIAQFEVLDQIARDLNIPTDSVRELINNGEAFAELQLDDDAKQEYQVPGSPTLVFNEGRQRLYGNVGYRIIEANIRELLQNNKSGEASWC